MANLPMLMSDTALAVPDVDAEAGASRMLRVDVPHQEQDQWCWCALTVGVSRFSDSTFALSQCETAARVLHVPGACDRPSADDVNRMFELDVALGTFGRLRQMNDLPLSFKSIQDEVDAGHPVGARVLFLDTGMAHFTLIRGYRTSPMNMLLIDDPLYDESEWSYQDFVESYRGSGEWQQSYRTQ